MFRKHPALMFGVIVDVILVLLTFFLPDHRTTLLLSIVGVSVLALLVWRFGRHSDSRTVTITNGRDVSVRNSVNRDARRPGKTSLTISDATGVAVDNSLNAGEATRRPQLPDRDLPG